MRSGLSRLVSHPTATGTFVKWLRRFASGASVAAALVVAPFGWTELQPGAFAEDVVTLDDSIIIVDPVPPDLFVPGEGGGGEEVVFVMDENIDPRIFQTSVIDHGNPGEGGDGGEVVEGGEIIPIEGVKEEDLIFYTAGGTDGEPLPYYRNNESGDPDIVVYPFDPIPGDDNPIIWYMGPPERLPFGVFARSANQRAVAHGLDAIVAKGAGPGMSAVEQLRSFSSFNGVRSGLQSISGEVYGSARSIGLDIGDRSLRIVFNRLIGSSDFLNGTEPLSFAGRSFGSNGDGNGQVRGQSGGTAPNLWVQGYGGSADLGGDGNFSGIDYQMGGLGYGIDLIRSDGAVLGVTGGHAFTSFGSDLNDNGDIKSHQFGLYGIRHLSSFYGMGVLNFGHNTTEVTRRIAAGPGVQETFGKFNSLQLGSYLEGGMNVDGEYVRFQPFVGLQHVFLNNGSSYERGTSPFNLNVNGASAHSLRTHLGARLVTAPFMSRRGVIFTPYMQARWMAELLGQSRNVVANLNGAPPTAAWVVSGAKSDTHFGQFGPGINVQLTRRLSLFANYDYAVGTRFRSHSGSGGLAFEF